MDKDISDPDLHELEDTLITVSLRTQAVISEAIYKDETLSTTLGKPFEKKMHELTLYSLQPRPVCGFMDDSWI
jgi:hypothetical protein